jgi:hypothetical protein
MFRSKDNTGVCNSCTKLNNLAGLVKNSLGPDVDREPPAGLAESFDRIYFLLAFLQTS